MTGAERVLLRRAALRLGSQAALLVATIVLLLAGIAVLVVVRAQHTDADRLLASMVTRAEDVSDPPAGVWLVVDGPAGRSATPHLPAGLPDTAALTATRRTGARRIGDLHAGGTEYRVLTQRRGDAVVQAALDLRADHEERALLLRALLLSGGVALALSGLAGAWFGQRAVQPLAEAVTLQQRFVADASHELRTPLTLLSTRAQLLRRRLRQEAAQHRRADPKAEADLDELVDDARQLTAILDDLLLAADPRAEVPADGVDLTALAEQVSAAAAQAEDHTVTITCVPSAPVVVRGSPGGLRRALTAMLDNAARHAASHVTVAVRKDRTHATVEVADDGDGIAPAIVGRMFERFASTTAPVPGQSRRYGLGLALAAEVAHRHGGTVSARNVPHGGAALQIRLPVVPAHPVGPDTPATQPAIQENSKKPRPGWLAKLRA